MKKTYLFLSMFLMGSLLMAQNDMYVKKMGETLPGFNSCETVEDYQELANQFGVIAKAEPEEWLPLYYAAHSYILMSFMPGVSGENRDSYLDQAEKNIGKMMEMVPDEPEALTLEAFCHTGRLVIDPASRAMSYQPLIAQALSKALALEPGHPRALFMKISNEMGTAAFFGSDTAPYCEQARKLLASWDQYELRSPIHPSWGKENVEGIVRQCGQ